MEAVPAAMHASVLLIHGLLSHVAVLHLSSAS